MRYKAGYQTEDGLKVITYRYYNNPDSAWKVLKRKAKREGFDTSRLREMPNKYIENSSNVGIRQENLNEPRGPIKRIGERNGVLRLFIIEYEE